MFQIFLDNYYMNNYINNISNITNIINELL